MINHSWIHKIENMINQIVTNFWQNQASSRSVVGGINVNYDLLLAEFQRF